MRALDIAATGVQAQQQNVEVIANNIANLNTTAFKRQRAEFQDLIYQNLERPGSSTSAAGNLAPLGVQVGLGVRTAAIGRNTEQGPISITDNTYDLAIQGNGYFQVTLPTGEVAYTRAGNFAVDDQGQLVTAQGYLIEPNITVPAEAVDVNIGRDGIVEVRFAANPEPQQIGQLTLASFINPAGLDASGDNLFLETAASGQAVIGTPGEQGFGTLQQGALENSNVNAVTEISRLIEAQRAYELNTRVIAAVDELLQAVGNIR
jgi:flagellar basal-body rod protein FlgG